MYVWQILEIGYFLAGFRCCQSLPRFFQIVPVWFQVVPSRSFKYMLRSCITRCRLAGVDPANSVGRVGRNKQIIQISTYSPLKL